MSENQEPQVLKSIGELVDGLTLRDIEIVETKIGRSIATLADGESPMAVGFAALLYVIQRKQNKKITYEEIMGFKLSDVMVQLGIVAGEESEEVKKEEPAPETEPAN